MSIAESFYLLKREQLNDLKRHSVVRTEKKWFVKREINNFYDFLEREAQTLDDLQYNQYNGGVYIYVLDYLASKSGIDIDKGRFGELSEEVSNNQGSTVFVLTRQYKDELFNHLPIEQINSYEVADFIPEEHKQDDPDLVNACMEALYLFYKHLNQLRDDSQILVFTLG